MKKILIPLILFVILCFPAYALSAVTDADPTEAEVTTLITGMSAGETLTFMGDATWDESVTINKAITINGNGHTLTSDGVLTNGFFYISGISSTSLIRITGFHFISADWTARAHIRVNYNNTADNIRIDNNTFTLGYQQIVFRNPVGLIDNNTFTNGSMGITYSADASAGSSAKADASWASITPGISDELYIEDNTFITNNFVPGSPQENISTANGGKICIRYNTFNGDNFTGGSYITPFMAHGNQYYYSESAANMTRGQSIIEIYNNTISSDRLNSIFILRGGSCLVYNNTATCNTFSVAYFYLQEEEWSVLSLYNPQRQAWPSEDQIHNSFFWNNTLNAAANSSVLTIPRNAACTANDAPYLCCSGSGTGNCNEAIVQDQDYFLHAPLAAGTGTDGAARFVTAADCNGAGDPYGCCTGSGTGNCRPGASDSHPTDGDPYANTGTMIFTPDVDNAYLTYVPYGTLSGGRYYHPLRDDIPSGSNTTLGSGSTFTLGSGAGFTLQ